MSDFQNVSVARAANVYFDGKVTSRTLIFSDGSKKTLGIMLPGEYEFGTEVRELMDITAGELEVKLPGQDWQSVSAGQTFEVPAQAKFQLRILQVTDYCCSYFD